MVAAWKDVLKGWDWTGFVTEIPLFARHFIPALWDLNHSALKVAVTFPRDFSLGWELLIVGLPSRASIHLSVEKESVRSEGILAVLIFSRQKSRIHTLEKGVRSLLSFSAMIYGKYSGKSLLTKKKSIKTGKTNILQKWDQAAQISM